MDMLWLKDTIDRLAIVNGVRWYGHVLRRDDGSVLRVALDLEVSGNRKRGRKKKTWRKQVEEIGLKKEDTPESRQVERRSASNCRRDG